MGLPRLVLSALEAVGSLSSNIQRLNIEYQELHLTTLHFAQPFRSLPSDRFSAYLSVA